jgi:S1-C subfamily serine protease
MEKITISANEVAETAPLVEEPTKLVAKLPPAIPGWGKAVLSPLVLVLPLLCVVTIVLRFAMRGLPPRIQDAWTRLLATLLTTSGLVTSVIFVLAVSFTPLPTEVSRGLTELDERSSFPTLPAAVSMTAKDVAEKLKPLVAVIAPVRRSWFTHENVPAGSLGAGVLLQADANGYTFLTARHVVDGVAQGSSSGNSDALLAMSTGTWGGAKVIARHKYLDLLMLHIPRESGSGVFAQPLAIEKNISEGENIFVIGHPEGLRFTLSSGIISRTDKSEVLQITAPISPGNSGGPVFDDRGNLVAIVTSMVDKHGDPNAENLNFAVRADALLRDVNWDFSPDSHRYLSAYLAGSQLQTQTSNENSK